MKRIHIGVDDLEIGEDFYLRMGDSHHYKLTCVSHEPNECVTATWKDLNKMVSGLIDGAGGVWVDREVAG